ncbi:UPF0755 protein [Microbacterium terrae]|uniref:Endolytic murein transglycosylase n=1 Tax=Microbacterium terrae TaxID=69369 RepID=A0A0M2GW60_9MICO|nr:endolytic transglycosylase MltG [Microbacterium terrae]KJL37964.1 putative aminodeoxychorismate lyase [Microbacterium terrae]MBP1077373.1 UPF0755 protein [Microbacterium terrae]GLJ98983.1 hypothetical protein GCM10017594_21800 [Microbacterium terrae]
MSDPSQPAAPGSRRAAREAAARQAPDAGATAPTPSPQPEPAPSSGTLPGTSTPGPSAGRSIPSHPSSGSIPTAPRPATAPVESQAMPVLADSGPFPAQLSTGALPVFTPRTPAAAAPAQAAASVETPRPSASADPGPVDDEPWIFGAVEAAPAIPYARGSRPAAPTPAAPLPQAAPQPQPQPHEGAQQPQETHGRTALAERPTGITASTATLEDLFTGESSTDDLGDAPPRPNKRKRRIGGWIALGVVLAILGGIAAGGWYVWTTYEEQIRDVMGWAEPKDYEEGLANGETYITIAEGDTGSPISQSLFDAGVTKTDDAFYDYLIETAQNPPFVPGVFKLQKQMTSEAALAALLDPANKMENTAQLREGLTVEQSLPLLAEGTGIELADYETAVADPSQYGVEADTLEGWLFPATYSFEPGVTATQVIQTLVDRTVESLDAAEVPEAQRQEILTIASIIQREARYEEDMQKVSTVIQNRLKPDNQETFGLLQMDSTAQYGYGEMHDGTVSSSAEALADDNPWNTYVHAGLPVGPIANPGDVAIDAAMHPVDGDWLYFVTVNLDTGETIFTTNLADHNRAVAQWQTWCADNPDSGC